MNIITVAGNIGKDAELRLTPKGESVCNFSVADSQGKDKPTIWWRCQLWGKRAEALSQYLTAGSKVTVTGEVTEREYQDKEGQQRKSMEVRVVNVALQGSSEPKETPKKPSHDAAKARQLQGSGFDDMEDDIPF